MNSRDEYVHKMQAKLEEWNSEIDTLTAASARAAAICNCQPVPHWLSTAMMWRFL